MCVQCFLGNDYGAVPVPAAIEHDEFRQLRNELLDSDEGQLFVYDASFQQPHTKRNIQSRLNAIYLTVFALKMRPILRLNVHRLYYV